MSEKKTYPLPEEDKSVFAFDEDGSLSGSEDSDYIIGESSRGAKTHPRDTWLRWAALMLASFLVFGNDYCYDLPQALENPIQEKFGVTEVQYNLLYSVYSLPNIVLPFVGGYILDYFGIKVGVLLYNLLILLGQSCFILGSQINSFPLLIIGRGIFGIGAESLNVAQSTIVNMWFKGKELSTALGISLCICRLGSSLNSYLTPLFFEQYKSISIVSLFGFGWVGFSFVCGLLLIKMDSKYLKNEEVENTEQINCKDFKKLNPSFWLLYLNAILCFLSFFSFLNIANKYLQLRFNFASTKAGGLLTIPYVTAGILTPILSNIIDRKGKKASLLIATCSLLSIVHFTFALIPDCNECMVSIVPLIFYGLFFALYTSLLISSVSVISDQKVIGTALGIIYSGQNTGLAIGPLVVGRIINDENKILEGYHFMSLVLGCCAAVATINSAINYWYDKKRNDGRLQKNMDELNDYVSPKKIKSAKQIEFSKVQIQYGI
jgi:MFS family permease